MREYRRKYRADYKENGVTIPTYGDERINKMNKAIRRALENTLPCSLNKRKPETILEFYDFKCPLTQKLTDLQFDHFIPITWGHGGTYFGNYYPLSKELNLGKVNKNPFEWIKQKWVLDIIGDTNLWHNFINEIAKLNQLNEEEFIEFVYWCENNKRKIYVVEEDRRMSVEIWKEYISNGGKADYSKLNYSREILDVIKMNQNLEQSKRNERLLKLQKEMPMHYLCKTQGVIRQPRKDEFGFENYKNLPHKVKILCFRSEGTPLVEWALKNDLDPNIILVNLREEYDKNG